MSHNFPFCASNKFISFEKFLTCINYEKKFIATFNTLPWKNVSIPHSRHGMPKGCILVPGVFVLINQYESFEVSHVLI